MKFRDPLQINPKIRNPIPMK